jgi:hypothetical protein
MSDTSQMPHDIEEILRDVEEKSAMRSTPEYTLGRSDAVRDIIDALMKDTDEVFSKTKHAAESFLSLVKKIHPEIVVEELRVGSDYSSSMLMPIALIVLSKEFSGFVPDVQDLARAMEQHLYNQKKFEGCIWTIANEDLDRNMLEADFPLWRGVGAVA